MATKTKVDPERQALLEDLRQRYGGWMNRPQVAEEFGFSLRTVNRMIAAGELKAYSIGRRRSLRVKTSDVAALVERVA